MLVTFYKTTCHNIPEDSCLKYCHVFWTRIACVIKWLLSDRTNCMIEEVTWIKQKNFIPETSNTFTWVRAECWPYHLISHYCYHVCSQDHKHYQQNLCIDTIRTPFSHADMLHYVAQQHWWKKDNFFCLHTESCGLLSLSRLVEDKKNSWLQMWHTSLGCQ